MKKLFVFLLMVPLLTSCAVRVFTGRAPVEYNEAQVEDLVFTENNANAGVRWKKEIFTPYFRFPHKVYFLRSNTAILSDGRLYYHDQQNLFALDVATGELVSKYEKPSKTEPQVVDMEKADIEGGKKVFPLVNFMGEVKVFLLLDGKDSTPKLISGNALPGIQIYANNKIIQLADDLANRMVFVWDFQQNQKPNLGLFLRKWFSDIYSVEVHDEKLILLFTKNDELHIESYDINTGTLIWQNQLDTIKPPDKSLYELIHSDALKKLQKLNELFIIETSMMDKETGELIERVTSLSPESGKVNWQMSDVTRVFTKRAEDDNDLFYLSKKGQPDIIYGVDQQTGEEKLKLILENYQHMHGIISSSDKIFLPTQKDFEKHPVQYDGFAVVSRYTGETEWTITLDEEQNSLPIFRDGILYFGQGPDYYKNLVAGSRKEYQYNLDSHVKEEFPDNFHKSAFAVDANTGKMLWQIKLQGGEESYIEKIMVKDNMAFIKSVSGWLYAIEYEKPVPSSSFPAKE